MKNKNKHFTAIAVVLLLYGSLLLGGCANNINPLEPPSPTNPPAAELTPVKEVAVTYNYTDTGKVELSDNNIVLKVGQRLILQPAPGLSKNTRFVSSGENFFGDVMKQEGDQTNKAVFTAIKPGKGKLQIIPNTTEVDRAVDLWVTVQ